MNLHPEPLPWQSKNLQIENSSKKAYSENFQPENKTEKRIPLNNMQWLALRAYEELLKLKNYSPHTISVYRNWFILFMNGFPNHKPSTITKNEIMDMLVKFRNSAKWSATSQNQLINAIKFFYEKLLNRPVQYYDLPRAQKPEQLPTVFAEEEILSMIKVTENAKHRAMLCLSYACGLRVSEIVDLKLTDIDSKRMVIYIRQGKGRKDRQVMLSEKLLELMRVYIKEIKEKEGRPKIWLFEGYRHAQYSTRSVQKVFKNAKEKAQIKKTGSVHAFRHSFATHLLEGGTDLLAIKELLGHNSLRTTMNYTHVSKKHINKIQSPFDKLDL